ncbi:MAG: hypothetical protein GQ570_00720 [Helicobacteraceae bacterium]|nr:hypothetical protein [Helicobacteraceae bacterium]
MTYNEELIARLEKAHLQTPHKQKETTNVTSHEKRVLTQIEEKLNLSQYDLSEEDILRTIKINNFLSTYQNIFKYSDALKVFFIITTSEIITLEGLNIASQSDHLAEIVDAMIESELIFINNDEEFELSDSGKSLSERIGLDIFY